MGRTDSETSGWERPGGMELLIVVEGRSGVGRMLIIEILLISGRNSSLASLTSVWSLTPVLTFSSTAGR